MHFHIQEAVLPAPLARDCSRVAIGDATDLMAASPRWCICNTKMVHHIIFDVRQTRRADGLSSDHTRWRGAHHDWGYHTASHTSQSQSARGTAEHHGRDRATHTVNDFHGTLRGLHALHPASRQPAEVRSSAGTRCTAHTDGTMCNPCKVGTHNQVDKRLDTCSPTCGRR